MDSIDNVSSNDVLSEWLEFHDIMFDCQVSLKRVDIEHVIEHKDKTTEISMKSGRSFYVNIPYVDIMNLLK